MYPAQHSNITAKLPSAKVPTKVYMQGKSIAQTYAVQRLRPGTKEPCTRYVLARLASPHLTSLQLQQSVARALISPKGAMPTGAPF